MAKRPSLLPGLLLLGACSQAPPKAPPQPAQVASSAPSASSPPASGWTAHDPRAVRCGVDDRPRNVISMADLPPAPEPALFADRAVPAIVAKRPFTPPAPTPVAPPNGGAPAPRRPPPPPPPELDVPPPDPDEVAPPSSRLRVERQPPVTALGDPLPPELLAAFATIDPRYEVCDNLATDIDLGATQFELELASNGTPLRVLPTREGQPSRHSRCLMERTCQYQARASLGQTTRLRVALRVLRDQPPEPPTPPTPPMPQVNVDAAVESPSPGFPELQLQLRTTAAEAARRCGPVGGRAQVRFTVVLDPQRRSGRRGFTVYRPSEVRTQNVAGAVPTPQIGCIVSALTGRMYPAEGSAPARSERLLLTWNP